MDDVSASASVEMLQAALFRQAKLHPGTRFHELYRTIHSADVLVHAYQRCRADDRGALVAGVDGQSFADIEAYGLDRWLEELALALEENSYRPDALLCVSIPLPNQKDSKVDIPTLRDRVCMSAAVLLLEPIFLADGVVLTGDRRKTALPVSQSGHDAPDLMRHLTTVSISEVLLALSVRIRDRQVLNLFKMWLALPMEEPIGATRRLVLSPASSQHRGIPLDLPISPLLIGIFARQFLLARQHSGESDKVINRLATPLDSHHAPSPSPGSPSDPSRSAPAPHQLGRSLLLSVILHLALLAVQFGEPGSGLPLLGWSGENRPASVPLLTATLMDQPPAEVAAQNVPLAELRAAPLQAPRSREPNRLSAKPIVQNASIVAKTAPVEVTGDRRNRVAVADPRPVKTETPNLGTEVITATAASTWSRPEVQTATDDDDALRVESARLNTAEQERIERERLTGAAQIELEKAQQAALAQEKATADAQIHQEEARRLALATEKAREKAEVQIESQKQAALLAAREDALASQRSEELARKERERMRLALEAKAREEAINRQVEAEALARQRAEELARKERERTRLALEAKAREEAINRQAEAEALARQRALDSAAQAAAAAERALTAERARAAAAAAVAAATAPRGDAIGAAGVKLVAGESGRDLAARALDGLRNSPAAFLPRSAAEPLPARRASILGRDPKDIQLAFYGEGWRQKIERIGSMNFPQLSKYLAYDPLVVTVSINSDGTLAGVYINKSSGHKELDDAVRRIIAMSAPFSAFPPALKRSYDVIDITRTWVFEGDRTHITGD